MSERGKGHKKLVYCRRVGESSGAYMGNFTGVYTGALTTLRECVVGYILGHLPHLIQFPLRSAGAGARVGTMCILGFCNLPPTTNCSPFVSPPPVGIVAWSCPL